MNKVIPAIEKDAGFYVTQAESAWATVVFC